MQHRRNLLIPDTLADVCDPDRIALIVYDMQVGVVDQLADGQQVTERVGLVLEAARQAIDKGYAGVVFHARAAWTRTRGVPTGTGWYADRAKSGGGAMLDHGCERDGARGHRLRPVGHRPWRDRW